MTVLESNRLHATETFRDPAELSQSRNLNWDLILSTLIIPLAFLLQGMSYVAGYHFNPTLSKLEQILAFWLLIAGGVYIVWPTRKRLNSKSFAFRFLLCLTCWFMLGLSIFKTDQGFEAFKKRIQTDMQPDKLATWLKSKESAEPANPVQRKVEPTEWALFAKETAPSGIPILVVNKGNAILQWGNDFETWRITRNQTHRDDTAWQGELYFAKAGK